MAKKKTVLIVDDHPAMREGIKAIMARAPRFQVVGETGDGEEALQLTRELKPDMIVMDISLPGRSGVEITRHVCTMLPEVRVIMLSVHSKVARIVEAFRAGARGYVTKESATEKLLDGLDAVSKGDYFLDTALSRQVVQGLMETPEKEAETTDVRYKSLTPREKEVMRLLVEGLSSKEIGGRLFISPRTVENHRANILNKLNLKTTLALVRYAVKINLVDAGLWQD